MPNVTDERIVKCLIKLISRGSMSFQELATSQVLSSNRNKTRECLTFLVDQRYVKQLSKDWRKGQILWIVPTAKGKKWLVEKVAKDIKETCRNLQVLVQSTSTLAQSSFTPEKIFKLKEAGTWVPKELWKKTPRVLSASEFHKMQAQKQSTIAPLWDVVKELVRILVQIQLPVGYTENLDNVLIQFTVEGEPLLTLQPDRSPPHPPESMLKGH